MNFHVMPVNRISFNVDIRMNAIGIGLQTMYAREEPPDPQSDRRH